MRRPSPITACLRPRWSTSPASNSILNVPGALPRPLVPWQKPIASTLCCSPVRPAKTAQQVELTELINARDGLVRDRTAFNNRKKNLNIALFKRQCRHRLEQIERHIGALDAEIAGLAPVARQSGLWKGKSFIRGGRTNERQAPYMPALVAARKPAKIAA